MGVFVAHSDPQGLKRTASRERYHWSIPNKFDIMSFVIFHEIVFTYVLIMLTFVS